MERVSDSQGQESDSPATQEVVGWMRIQVYLPEHVVQWLYTQEDELFPNLSAVCRKLLVQAMWDSINRDQLDTSFR